MSSICDEFGVLPEIAWRALQRDRGILRDVLAVRQFVKGWRAIMEYEDALGSGRTDVKRPRLNKSVDDRISIARHARLKRLKEGSR